MLSALVFHVLMATYPDDSIFWLKSEWTNQDAQKMKLSDLSSTPIIVSMVFLGCKFTCPLTIQDMREMDELLQASQLKDYKLVLISIDPDRDTPKAMKEFMKERKLDPKRWVLLASRPENVRELAAALGYSYKNDKAMDFAHSMLTWVFDKQGALRFTRTARRESNAETANAVKALLK